MICLETAREVIYEAVSEEGDECHDCPYWSGTPDAYGTGDSPTLYECAVDGIENCIGVMRLLK